jgi:hypothetical protein
MRRLAILALLAASAMNGQCVMCQRTAAAQNVERARVLNRGIIVMLIPPLVVLGGLVALAWKRNHVHSWTGENDTGLRVPVDETQPSAH